MGKRANKKAKVTIRETVSVSNRSRRVRQARARPRAEVAMAPVLDYAESLISPFTKSACIPDGANGVGCFSVKQNGIIGTGTGTSCAILLNLQPAALTVIDSGSTAGTPTISGNWAAASQNTTIAGIYSAYRPVSGGLRVTYVGNTQTDQGVLLLGLISPDRAPSNMNGATLGNFASACMSFKQFPLRNGGEIIWRPDSIADAEDWVIENTGTVAVTQSVSAPYMVAAVYGASANTASLLSYELVANFEGQFEEQTFLSGGLNQNDKTPAIVGWYETARNIANKVEYIRPMLQTAFNVGANLYAGNYIGALASLGNGIQAPGMLNRSSLGSGPRMLPGGGDLIGG